jgi:hypothetical protein
MQCAFAAGDTHRLQFDVRRERYVEQKITVNIRLDERISERRIRTFEHTHARTCHAAVPTI